MKANQIPAELPLSLANCCALASQVWRLDRYVNSIAEAAQVVSLRYTVRQLSRLLEDLKIAIVDVAGQPYDPGMIQEVVEVINDPEMVTGQQMIESTVSPTITWNGAIVQPGQVSVRRSESFITEVSD